MNIEETIALLQYYRQQYGNIEIRLIREVENDVFRRITSESIGYDNIDVVASDVESARQHNVLVEDGLLYEEDGIYLTIR